MVMVWAGISYGQWTQFAFWNLNAQRYSDEILRPIVVPFIRHHHLMFQHDNARHHVVEDLNTIPGSWKWPSSSMACILTWHSLSMLGMLWIDVYDSTFQFPPISSNFSQPFKRSETTFHRPQSTAWSTLWDGDVSHCMRQMWLHHILSVFLIHV
jgi:hypothetical protein